VRLGKIFRGFRASPSALAFDLAAAGVHILSMSFDISALLDQWDYQPGQVVVRKFRGKDGLDKIQLRVDLGLLQMNAKGRPDGKRPFGHESLLEHYQELLERFRREHATDDKSFRLTPDDCGKLQQEAIQYHHRYICLFQLEDFDGVIQDAERNLKAFDFVQRYAGGEELAWQLQQFRPQLLMMRVRARGAIALKDNHYDEVIRIVESGLEEIRQFYRDHERQDLLETSGELQSLEMWLQEIQSKRPLSPREKLESALNEAVRNENYEEAARVRDALRKMS
jgi:UvrB/uvrC motif